MTREQPKLQTRLGHITCKQCGLSYPRYYFTSSGHCYECYCDWLVARAKSVGMRLGGVQTIREIALRAKGRPSLLGGSGAIY